MASTDPDYRLGLIAAVARNGTIGKDNRMPWHLPNDLKYFKQVTLGKPIIMGRKTLDSLGKPLPGRENIVITRNPSFQAEGVHVAGSLDEAIATAQRLLPPSNDEIMVIGGAEIYQLALPLADTLYLTEVDADVEGDAHFPDFDRSLFAETSRVVHEPCEKNPYGYAFVTWQRKQHKTP